jgi:hypothetical protein
VSNVKSNGRINNGAQIDVASAPLVGEKEEYVPDEEATVADDEDIKYTSYNLSIHRGSLSLYGHVDSEMVSIQIRHQRHRPLRILSL